jgi:hypothetical protein
VCLIRLARLALGSVTVWAFQRFLGGLGAVYGREIARWTLLWSLSQFHLLFYASRTLPNTFALILCKNNMIDSGKYLYLEWQLKNTVVLLGAREWILMEKSNGRWSSVLRWMVPAMTLFRSELVLLVGAIGFSETILFRRAPFVSSVTHVAILSIICICKFRIIVKVQ